MMRKLYIVAALLSIFFLTSPLKAETIEVVVTDYPPISTEKVFEGLGHGMHADMAEAIIKKAGYTPKFTYRPFKRMLMEFGGKKYTYIATSKRTLAAIGAKTEVLNYISLGKFYNHYFYFKSDLGKEIKYEGPADLKGYKVCLNRGSYATAYLRKAGVHVEEANSQESCLNKLNLKRNDIWGSTAITANYYTRKLFPNRLGDLSHTPVTASSTDEMMLATFKGNPASAATIEKLDAAFTELKKDGTILAIIKKYWGDDVPKRILPPGM